MKSDSNNPEILFENFDCLNKDEILVAKKMVEKYLQKIKKRTTLGLVKLEMRAHVKTKITNFEVRGRIEYTEGVAISSQQDANSFVAIDSVMSKIYEEIKHKIDKK